MTTQTLEETIRGLVARGEISDLGLSMNSSRTKWRAHFTPCSQFGVSYAEDEDPIKALLLAMTTAKLKTRAPRVTVAKIAQPDVEVVADAGIDALM